MNLTTHNLKFIRSVNGYTSPHFDIVIGETASSYCLFWNLRAMREGSQSDRRLGRRVLFFPRKYLEDRAWLDAAIELLTPLVDHEEYRK